MKSTAALASEATAPLPVQSLLRNSVLTSAAASAAPTMAATMAKAP